MTDERPSTVRVACCQLSLQIGDVEGNLGRLADAARGAADAGASVIVLPELANTGYMFEGRHELTALAEPCDGPTVQGWQALSAETGVVLVAGYAEAGDDDLLYNSLVAIDHGDIVARYRKVHLWNTEKAIFTPGAARPPVVDTSAGRLGFMICYDLEFPEWVRHVALDGAELLAAPVNWPSFPRPNGERPAEIVRVQADAAVNRMFIAACDRVGTERGQDWVGGTVIVDVDGFPVTPIALGEEYTAMADLGLADARRKAISDVNDVFTDRRTDLY